MARPKKDIKTWRKACGTYYVQFADYPGKWFSSGQSASATAIAWAKRHRASLLRMDSATLGEFAKGFYDDKSAWVRRRIAKLGRDGAFSAEFLPQHRARLKNYLMPAFKDFPLQEITRRMFDDWLLELKGVYGGQHGAESIKNSTKNKIIDCLKHIMVEAVDQGIIEHNPIDGIKPFGRDEDAREVFNAPELKALFPVDRGAAEAVWLSQMWLSYFVILRDTGIRPGELHALTWGDWMPEYGGFPITKAIENKTGRVKGTKTGSVKPAYLSTRGLQELEIWRTVSKHTDPKDLIFSFDGRGHILTETAAKHFRGACARAGVDRRRRTPYCLRHSFATFALDELPLALVQKLLGHSANSLVALRSYYHPSPDNIMRSGLAARDALDKTGLRAVK
jgi:integrase